MSVTIHYKGLPIVCESPDEAAAVAERLAASLPRTLELPFEPNGKLGKAGNGDAPTLRRIISKLGPRQKNALRTLANHGGRMRATDLARSAGEKTLSTLAAVLNPIYRLSEQPGVAQGFFFKETKAEDDGSVVIEYVISEIAVEEVKQAVSR